LSDAVKEEFPPKVVFIRKDEETSVLSMEVDRFLLNRAYEGISETHQSIMSLVSGQVQGFDDSEDDVDIDSVEVDSNLFRNEEASTDEEDLIEEPAASSLSIRVGPVHNAELIQQSFIIYSQEPQGACTLHKLKFELVNGLSLKELSRAFALSNPEGVHVFEVATASRTFKIETAAYLNTWLEADASGDIGVVHLLTEGDINADPEPEVSEQEDAVEVEGSVEVESNEPETVEVEVVDMSTFSPSVIVN
jgi:hypothetical protein